MNFTSLSIIREKQYRTLSTLTLDGIILDVGGSTKSGYHSLLQGKHKIQSVNLDETYGCDLVFDVEKSFPLENESYDHVLCLNLLEHVFEFEHVVAESCRVLKSGGSVHFFAPFFFHIHGSPDDYLRYTESAWRRLFEKNDLVDIRIIPTVSGVFGALYQTVLYLFPIKWMRIFLKKICVGLDATLCKISKKYQKIAEKIPFGYYATAVKR